MQHLKELKKETSYWFEEIVQQVVVIKIKALI